MKTIDTLTKISLLVLALVIIAILTGCSNKPAPWSKQEEVIPPPVDLSHCDKNTIYVGKPKCGGE